MRPDVSKLLCILLLLISTPIASFATDSTCTSNPTVQRLYAEAGVDWNVKDRHQFDAKAVMARDKSRIAEVKQLQVEGKICSGEDYMLAAIVAGHGLTFSDFVETIQLASTAKSLLPDSLEARRLFAASLDRLLVRMSAKRLFGVDARSSDVPVLKGAIDKSDIDSLRIDKSSASPFCSDHCW